MAKPSRYQILPVNSMQKTVARQIQPKDQYAPYSIGHNQAFVRCIAVVKSIKTTNIPMPKVAPYIKLSQRWSLISGSRQAATINKAPAHIINTGRLTGLLILQITN